MYQVPGEPLQLAPGPCQPLSSQVKGVRSLIHCGSRAEALGCYLASWRAGPSKSLRVLRVTTFDYKRSFFFKILCVHEGLQENPMQTQLQNIQITICTTGKSTEGKGLTTVAMQRKLDRKVRSLVKTVLTRKWWKPSLTEPDPVVRASPTLLLLLFGTPSPWQVGTSVPI